MPRFHCPTPLRSGDELDLPPGAARHVQVLRLQPGDGITLFEGRAGEGFSGGEFDATVLRMGRSDVSVRVGAHHAIEREALRPVHLLAGITANERMDWLVEKAAELGAASITPLVAERSVLKLKGDRAEKKLAHWQAVAVSACEQCMRNRVPPVHGAADLAAWLDRGAAALPPGTRRLLLSLGEGTRPLAEVMDDAAEDLPVVFLSGPEGGLSSAEEALARSQGFIPVTLGARVLRAETAPLAALAALTLV
ncbi:MAG: 16S rRNA (uracil(1498)-N(3))-methyltransferase [Burkholderiaceae bacterium]|jgi:16S rRNA (uracil1498-N3)-methyltransferase|nr:16S rRNA (uracil(1498)-N(3))-methyltransferase [Burkholderiaceae bacterium]